MLKIHTSDGKTHRVDLSDEVQARKILAALGRDDFQRTVKAVSLVEHHTVRCTCACGARPSRDFGVQYSVARPDGFDKAAFSVEAVEPGGRVKGGERVVVHSGDVRLTLMAHSSQPAARIQVTKTGKQQFNPLSRRQEDAKDNT